MEAIGGFKIAVVGRPVNGPMMVPKVVADISTEKVLFYSSSETSFFVLRTFLCHSFGTKKRSCVTPGSFFLCYQLHNVLFSHRSLFELYVNTFLYWIIKDQIVAPPQHRQYGRVYSLLEGDVRVVGGDSFLNSNDHFTSLLFHMGVGWQIMVEHDDLFTLSNAANSSCVVLRHQVRHFFRSLEHKGTVMFYKHFYRHLLSVNDTFLIWTFQGSVQHHKVKAASDEHNVECFCPGPDIIICTDLNYINERWETAPVLSHGECTASPPSWRQIEIGKYVRVQHLLQVATYAVMIGGAIVLHKAGTAAQASMASEPVGGSLLEQTASRPMSIQEMSQLSSV